MRVKVGDPVTVALRWRHRSAEQLSRTEVAHATPFFNDLRDRTSDGFMANDDDRNVHYFVDEGITWVRGHVADDSPEGIALIAAHALAPKSDSFANTGAPTSAAAYDQRHEVGK
jgi:hypothetical protein